MNILGELQRLWAADGWAVKLVPAAKVFSGRAPDTYQDDKGQTVQVNVPYISIRYIDGFDDGGTNETQTQQHTIQLSAYAAKRSDAERIRDYAAELFEDCQLKLGGAIQNFQDCSLGIPGELSEADGIYELFQRFQVEVTLQRPKRKGV